MEKERARRQRRQMKYLNNRRLGRRHKNFSQYINLLAKKIVRKAKEYQACIVLEKLKGLKRKGAKKPKWARKLLHRWCYHDLIQKIKKLSSSHRSPRNTSKIRDADSFIRGLKIEDCSI